MKIQYLGDSKDCFTWDYHDYLTDALRVEALNILLMMTPDDNSNDGQTKPDRFPARGEIIEFCYRLRALRDLSIIKSLPVETGASYRVHLHKPEMFLKKDNRDSYFKDITRHGDQVVFLDPDNGFEPEKRFNEKHVCYKEVSEVYNQVAPSSIISVCQHFRRIRFTEDLICIKERLKAAIPSACVTAIFWHQLMFVLIGKSKKRIEMVRQLNQQYLTKRPVKII